MSIASTTLVDLLRHGEPRGGSRYRGHLDDPLSDIGWRQMRAAIGDGEQWDHILTSPLRRCRCFAEQLAGERDLPCTVVDGFKELHFGHWEGLTPAQVDQRFGDSQARFRADAASHAPDGGDTLHDFHARVAGAWDHWHRALAGQRLLLVGHAGVIRMLLAEVLGLAPARALAGFLVPYANRSRVRLDDSEHGLLSCLVSHGPGVPEGQ